LVPKKMIPPLDPPLLLLLVPLVAAVELHVESLEDV